MQGRKPVALAIVLFFLNSSSPSLPSFCLARGTASRKIKTMPQKAKRERKGLRKREGEEEIEEKGGRGRVRGKEGRGRDRGKMDRMKREGEEEIE